MRKHSYPWDTGNPDGPHVSLLDALPSGSGFDLTDGGWSIHERRDGGLTLRSEYHVMNANGYYCGWRGVVVVVDRDNAASNAPWHVVSVRVNERGPGYGLGDYIGDTVADALREVSSVKGAHRAALDIVAGRIAWAATVAREASERAARMGA